METKVRGRSFTPGIYTFSEVGKLLKLHRCVVESRVKRVGVPIVYKMASNHRPGKAIALDHTVAQALLDYHYPNSITTITSPPPNLETPTSEPVHTQLDEDHDIRLKEVETALIVADTENKRMALLERTINILENLVTGLVK